MRYKKGEDMEWKIQHAAMLTVVENGLASTSMALIARRARTGMGAIYNYFPTKEDLINSLYVKIRDLLNPVGIKDPADTEVKDFFFDFANHYLSFFIHREREFFLFIDQCESSPIISQESKQIDAKYFWPLAEALAKGQRERLIRDNISADALAYLVKGSLDGFLKWFFYRYKDKYSTNYLQTTQMIWEGLKCPGQKG